LNSVPECAKCGACTAGCPVYQSSGRESLTARGKLHLLSKLPPAAASPLYADILSRCLLCGACSRSCPQRIDPPARIVAARGELHRRAGRGYWRKYLARQLLARPSLLSRTLSLTVRCRGTLLKQLPTESGLRLRLGFLSGVRDGIGFGGRYVQENESAAPTISYFVGCHADHLEHGIARATSELARRVTGAIPATPVSQVCCGQAAYSCGEIGQARELARRNIMAFADHELPILTSCASCFHHLLQYPVLLADDSEWRLRAEAFAGRLLEFSSYFAGKNVATASPGTVFYHDPCHLRFDPEITAPPRHLLRSAGLKLVELPGGPRCCGQGGLFHLAHPELAAGIRDRLLNALQVDIDLATTTCSGCLLQLRQGLIIGQAKTACGHLAEVLTGSLIS
jgi:glycolate oxidase iron-sulfur subunit